MRSALNITRSSAIGRRAAPTRFLVAGRVQFLIGFVAMSPCFLSTPDSLATVKHVDDPAAPVSFADPVGLAVGDPDVDDVMPCAL